MDLRRTYQQLAKWKFQAKFQGELSEGERNGEKFLLCKPQTYMNNSGNIIAPLMRFYQISTEELLVIHDEIDFPTGRIALKFGGSAAGHNGLKSTIEKLGTKNFRRLRIGIDRPKDQQQVTNWVLGKFKSEEKKILEKKIPEIFTTIEDFLLQD